MFNIYAKSTVQALNLKSPFIKKYLIIVASLISISTYAENLYQLPNSEQLHEESHEVIFSETNTSTETTSFSSTMTESEVQSSNVSREKGASTSNIKVIKHDFDTVSITENINNI